MSTQPQILVMLIDTTGSMADEIYTLKSELPAIIATAALTGAFDAIRVFEYKDYNAGDECIYTSKCWGILTDKLGLPVGGINDVMVYTSGIRASSGGGSEALNSGLYAVLKECLKSFKAYTDPEANDSVPFVHLMHIGDQLPHGSHNSHDRECKKESSKLGACFGFNEAIKHLYHGLRGQLNFSHMLLRNADTFYTNYTKQLCGSTYKEDESLTSIIESWMTGDFMDPVEVKPVLYNSVYTGLCEYRKLEDLPKPRKDSNKAHRNLVLNVQSSLKRITTDPDYHNIVLQLLIGVCKANVMEFVNSSVVGAAWRAYFSLRGIDKAEISYAINDARANLPANKAKILSDWIAESYNAKEEANSYLAEFTNIKGLIRYNGTKIDMKPKEIINALTAFTADGIRVISGAIGGLVVDQDFTSASAVTDGIPIELPDLWSYVLHIIVPGCVLSKRLATLLSVICYRHGGPLADIAFKHLESLRSGWFVLDQTVPENYSVPLLQTLNSHQLRSIQTFDRKYVEMLLNISKINPNKVIETVKLEYKHGVFPDRTIKCSKCKKMRSTSICVGNVCGICITDTRPEYADQVSSGPQMQVNCGCCKAYYAVALVYYNQNPKRKYMCHYCRGNESPCYSVCTGCNLKIVTPEGNLMPNYKCEPCSVLPVYERNPIAVKSMTSLSNLISIELLRPYVESIWNFKMSSSVNWSTFSRSLYAISSEFSYSDPDQPKLELPVSIFGDYLNAEDLRNHVVNMTGFEFATCDICFGPQFDGLQKLCGNDNCNASGCTKCKNAWFGQNVPGHIVSKRTLECCVCTQVPKNSSRLVTKLHTEIGNRTQAGWCINCLKLEDLPNLGCGEQREFCDNYTCSSCKIEPKVVMRNCPGCKAPTVRASGCAHIKCPCDTHWCYICETKFEVEDIYEHLKNSHGTSTDPNGFNMI